MDSSLLIDDIVVPCITYDPPSAKVKGSPVNEDKNDEPNEHFPGSYNPNPELYKRASTGRPPQTLFNATLAKQRFRRAFQERNNLFLFKGLFYDSDGYALFKRLDTDWYTAEDVVPTPKEFELFSASSEIPLKV